jgi:hypothetical protein
MTDKEFQKIGEKIRILLEIQTEHEHDSAEYNAMNDEIRSLVGETDGKAQQFVDAFERVIH